MDLKKNKIYFINKAKEKFGDKYDYSNVDYVDSKTKVKIVCNQHKNYFYQAPSEHLRGYRVCEFCLNRITNTNSLKEKLLSVHGNEYDYSNVVYVDSKTKVKIICTEHGEFEKLPNNYKQGCPKCYDNKRGESKKFKLF